ncbi:MAG: hypothetical protein KGJ02_07110 [Verrucomicrobiota bacterium]|nr:hypothetical protein [Verrucomicrobiota bacterium]
MVPVSPVQSLEKELFLILNEQIQLPEVICHLILSYENLADAKFPRIDPIFQMSLI